VIYQCVLSNEYSNYIHEKIGGEKILDWLQKSENKHPGFWGKAGEYPIIKVTK